MASETFLEGIQYLLRVRGHPSREIDCVWWLTVSNTSILLWILQLWSSNGHKLPLSWGCEPFQVEPAVYPFDKVMMQHPVEPQAQGWRTHFRGEMWHALTASRSYWDPVPNLVKSFVISRKLHYPIKVLHHEKDKLILWIKWHPFQNGLHFPDNGWKNTACHEHQEILPHRTTPVSLANSQLKSWWLLWIQEWPNVNMILYVNEPTQNALSLMIFLLE